MAYVDRHSSRQRAPIIAAVAALHVGAIYAVASGLSVIVPPLLDRPPTEAHNIRLPPPPPPDPKPRTDPSTPRKDQARVTQSTTPLTVAVNNASAVEVDRGLASGELPEIGEIVISPPPADPAPVLAPKFARPRGQPGLWVTPEDYPAADLRAGREGTTRFRLAIGTDGRVQDCEIVVSSGSASLDAAACAKLRQRARFTPSTDASGALVPGSYSSAVKWTIPKD